MTPNPLIRTMPTESKSHDPFIKPRAVKSVRIIARTRVVAAERDPFVNGSHGWR